MIIDVKMHLDKSYDYGPVWRTFGFSSRQLGSRNVPGFITEVPGFITEVPGFRTKSEIIKKFTNL